MIAKRTTLILGAGASAPYGFPLGIGLRDALLDGTNSILPQLIRLGIPPPDWHSAHRALEESQFDTVDEFLSRYLKQHGTIMKIAVAFWVNHAESRESLINQRRADHWYKVLVRDVLRDDPNLGDGKLSVVTFNYDNSLEMYLFLVLQARFGMSEAEARASIGKLQVVHVYGHLGPIQGLHGAGRPYGSFESENHLSGAAEGIATCFEPGSTGAVDHAKRQIRESDVVAFLGFGYSRENMGRLDLRNTIRPGTRSVGSVFNVQGYDARIRECLPMPLNFRPAPHSDVNAVATTSLINMLTIANEDGNWQ